MEEFYVYIYRNPLKNNEPFYVGKGKGGRAYKHLRDAKNPNFQVNYKINTIRKILTAGLEPTIEIVDLNLDEQSAFELEMFLIQEIGRKDIGTGPLVNLTNGGEGSTGFVHSEDSKKKISEAILGQAKSETMRQRLSDYHKENPELNPMKRSDVAAKISGENSHFFGKVPYNKGILMTAEARAAFVKSGEEHPQYGKPKSTETKAKISASKKGIPKTEEEKAKMRKPKKRVTCPHCGKEGGSNNMYRWHFDNCKEKTNATA